MKIGIYAGTFDPIHNGHIAFAEQALREAGLDRVIMVAEKTPYRKQPAASWDHRQAMIERATEATDNVDHDYAFANELSQQHTMVDMLGLAKKHYGTGAEIWFLVGSDIYEHMHQWHDMVDNEAYGGFIVALRDDHTHDWLEQRHQQLERLGRRPNAIVLESKHRRITSSSVRLAASQNVAVDTTPAQVNAYILEHHLYGAG